MDMNTQTATATKVGTNTRLAVATLAMLAAGGAAYIAAAVPTSNQVKVALSATKVCQQINTGYGYNNTTGGITILDTQTLRSSQLNNGCRDAGHGLRNYTLTCNAADAHSYYVSYTDCNIPTPPPAPLANVVITFAPNNETFSAIRTPGPLQFSGAGRWQLTAKNEDVTLQRITLQMIDIYGNPTNTNNTSTLTLLNGSTVLGTAPIIPGSNNGYVRFDGLNLKIAVGSPIFISLGTGDAAQMEPALVSAFSIRSDSADDIKLVSITNNQILTPLQIDGVEGDDTVNSRFAPSFYHLYHIAAPVISAVNFGNTLNLSPETKLFKFTIANYSPIRALRIGDISITVGASGLADTGYATGTIGNFSLWEADSSGEPSRKLNTNATCRLSGGNPNPLNGCAVGGSNPSLDITFGGAFADIPKNWSRTYVLTADTSNMFKGKTNGSISVYTQIKGGRGSAAGDTTDEPNWTNGGVHYFYRPAGQPENTVPYSGSDTYPVAGPTLTRVL